LDIDAPRLLADLAELSRIGRNPGVDAGITRSAFSAEDAEARAWYVERVAAAGLELRTDGLGNMFVRAPHDRASGPAVWSGSHLDTVPSGGAFDGALGAVAALECVRRIAEARPALVRPVGAVVFSDEEGAFASLLGSSALRAPISPEQVATLRDRDGRLLRDALSVWPWSTGEPWDTRLDPAEVHRFVELHIEQGPVLERDAVDIGVVTAIVALGGADVAFVGRADHAGTTPMPQRADALVAASAFVSTVPAVVEGIAPDAVATAGMLRVAPGAANVVPGRVELSLDYRDIEPATVDRIERALRAAAEGVAREHGADVEWAAHEMIPSAPLDEGVRAAIAAAAAGRGLRTAAIRSGAGHDSQNMSRIAPTGMIFVPSVGGRSHSPAELTYANDVVNGANVLLDTLIRLAS
jgi:N-carbamoyl-L-amino-acid hydrolase